MPWEFRITLMLAALTTPLAIYLMSRINAALSSVNLLTKTLRRSISALPLIWYALLPLTYLSSVIGKSFGLYFSRDAQVGADEYLLLFPFWIMLIVILETTPYFIALDLFNLLARAVKLRKNRLWQQSQAFAKIALLLCISIYVSYRSAVDTYRIQSHRQIISLNNLPPELADLKIVLFSDLQVDRFTQVKKLDQLTQILKNENADYILFAGDLVTSGKNYTDQAAKLMKQIQATNRLAVIGDHDYWSDPQRIPQKLRAGGWSFLQDEHKVIDHRGKKLLVTGVTHIYSKKINAQQLRILLASAPQAEVKILLVHQPAEFIAEIAATYGYHLMLAGHTHGGGIVSHIFGIPVTPSQKETRYYQGFFVLDGLKIIVTNGIGNTLSPLRYHAPAEVSILQLAEKKETS